MLDMRATICLLDDWCGQLVELRRNFAASTESVGSAPQKEATAASHDYVVAVLKVSLRAAMSISKMLMAERLMLAGQPQKYRDLVETFERYTAETGKTIQALKDCVSVASLISCLDEIGSLHRLLVIANVELCPVTDNPSVIPPWSALGLRRDLNAPAGFGDHVARTPATSDKDAFTIDLAGAKAFRDLEHRLTMFMRKRAAPSENGGPLSEADIKEESELRRRYNDRIERLQRPASYDGDEAMRDSERLQQLSYKRMYPPSCGGGELKGAEDEEEAILTVKAASVRYSPEGRDHARLFDLSLMTFGGSLRADEQRDLDLLSVRFPLDTKNPTSKAMREWKALHRKAGWRRK